jgi:hypothetical protein
MKSRLPSVTFAAICFAAIVACKPSEPVPTATGKTAVVEEKIRQFKADPSKTNLNEVDKALADLNVEIKELEIQEAKAGGAKKDEITRKLSDLRAKYNACNGDFTAAKVQAGANKATEATAQALQKAGEAVKGATESVRDSLKSGKGD